ncbi:MAG TPA: hypothetical protein VHM88_08280, partial [Candidatus Acidoferrales bacterium]|nr:hypothetical protein [Candidatus Acidoferrales bacterium]
MKLPVVWIVAALAAGIVLANLHPAILPERPAAWLALAVVAMLAGLALLWRDRLAPAWVFALMTWGLLGVAAARLEPLAKPANHISNLLAQGRLDTS